MQLNLERPDYTYFLRNASGMQAWVNDRVLTRSFIIAPDTLIEDWPACATDALQPEDMQALLALSPELVVVGTGATQVFPSAAVMAACLTRGIGIEVMANAAAARTFNVLASEGRRVAAGFIFPAGPDAGL